MLPRRLPVEPPISLAAAMGAKPGRARAHPHEIRLETAAATVSADGLQFWDAVICAASQAAGARALFTEDMQDGRVLGGLGLINPFAPGAGDQIVAARSFANSQE